jgi:hypothetical protein
MYIVRDTNGNVIAIATRIEDARAMTSSKLDKIEYIIEEVKND